MRKLITLLLLFVAVGAYCQPKLDLVNRRQMIIGNATDTTADTVDTSKWEYFKFSLAVDTAMAYTFTNWSSTDSSFVYSTEVWNEPDWLDGKIYQSLIIKSLTEYNAKYRLWIWGRQKLY